MKPYAKMLPISDLIVETDAYMAKADGKSKRAALDAAYSSALTPTPEPVALWNDDASLMKFLSELCGS